MGKKDEYRFNLRFDETDEMHRLVVKYLNSCGHNKAKYIVRAFLAYWKMSGKSLLSYVFPEIDAEQLLPEAKQENDKKTAAIRIRRYDPLDGDRLGHQQCDDPAGRRHFFRIEDARYRTPAGRFAAASAAGQ